MKIPEHLQADAWCRAADANALAQRLATDVAAQLRQRLQERAQVILAVSGGSTPKPFFKALSGMDLEWSRVIVLLVDERWVAPEDDRSNEKLVREYLLQDKAAEARLTGLKTRSASAAAAIDEVNARIESLPLPIDVLILGMGGDGHTASLFPGMPNLKEALSDANSYCAPATAPDAPTELITLTGPVLSAAKSSFLHIVGPNKRDVLIKAGEHQQAELYPIWALVKKADCRVYWAEA